MTRKRPFKKHQKALSNPSSTFVVLIASCKLLWGVHIFLSIWFILKMAIFALEVAAFQNPEFAQITLDQLWIWHRSVGPFARHLFRHAQNQSNSLRTSAPSFPTTRTTAPVLRSEEKLTRLRSVSLFFIQMINMFCPFLWHSCGSLEFSMAFVHGLGKKQPGSCLSFCQFFRLSSALQRPFGMKSPTSELLAISDWSG